MEPTEPAAPVLSTGGTSLLQARTVNEVVNGMIEKAEFPADLDPEQVDWEQLARETPRLVREAQASLGF